MNVETLRRLRNNSISKISAEMEKITNPSSSYGPDERFWKLEADKAGNATATIRFLPATIKEVDGIEVCDDLPWVRLYNHGFQGPTGRWLIENCPTTIGEPCPICSSNSADWNSGIEDNKEIARKQKRKLRYYANVLIVSDPKHPENDGQVKIFSFGPKIFDKIMDKMNPVFEDEEPVNVFDYWEGADFKLRQRKVEGYPNFDQSVFMNPSAIGSDDEIVSIAKKQHLLKDLVDKKQFKSYAELEKKFNEIRNGDNEGSKIKSVTDLSSTSSRSIVRDSSGDIEFDRPVKKTETTPPFSVESTKSISSSSAMDTSSDDDDDTLAYFRKIAMED